MVACSFFFSWHALKNRIIAINKPVVRNPFAEVLIAISHFDLLQNYGEGKSEREKMDRTVNLTE
jgi:hypothetical protein